jgi:hypothetical protein
MYRTDYHELDHRESNGFEVTLFWSASTDTVSVVVKDEKSGDVFELDVEPELALDAFHHPYAYAAHRGVDYAAGARDAVHA